MHEERKTYAMRRHMWSIVVALGLLSAHANAMAADESPEQPQFTFAVSSDPHASEDHTNAPTGKEKLSILLRQIEARSPRPDFLLITGDLHAEPFKEFLANRPPGGIPIHVVFGNHEDRPARDTLHSLFPADFKGNDFYSFTNKNSLFIGLCDAAYRDHIGHLNSESIQGPEQCAWLRQQLENNYKTAEHIFIYGHIPPHPNGTIDGGMSLSVNDQVFLRELVQKYPVTAMFFGHLHYAMEFKLGSTPVYVMRSSNWNFYDQPRGFVEVKVFKDRIATEFVPADYSRK